MRFVSYAQNFEDVILWRALKGAEDGFYIDVGAQDPVVDSVSLAFYERGWRGVHIEPNAEYAEKLRAARPDEEVFDVAINSNRDEIAFYAIPGTGMSTGDEQIARMHEEQGWQVERVTARCLPLCDILERFRDRDIHWLKIDVEGMEEQAIESWGASEVRPWIVIVESTKPNSPEPVFMSWEPRLTALGYEFVYFDGLNRFYLSKARLDLRPCFGPGPNVFDDFVLAQTVNSNNEVAAVWDALTIVREDKKKVEATLQEERTAKDALNSELQREKSQNRTITAELDAERAARRELEGHLKSRFYRTANAVRKFAHGQRDFSRRIRRAARGKLSKAASLQRVLSRFPLSQSRLDDRARAERTKQFRQQAKRALSADDAIAADTARARRLPFAPAEMRVFYIFVDHTVQCPLNTGLQRVARGIGRGLTALGEQVRYVKWDGARKACVLIDMRERRYLAEWNGPPLTEDEEQLYSDEPGAVAPPIGEAGDLNGWLIVPEVTHITPHPEPVTLDLIGWAKRSGVRTGFVFYDAIPLKCDEYDDMAEKHRQYMQEIRLADAVWPISHWSGDDLLSYWRHFECAEAATIPSLSPRHLPAEFSEDERPASEDCGDRLILCVGTLCPRKNQLLLIEAFQDYLRRMPGSSWQLVLAGHMHPLVADAVKASESAAIRYAGPVSDEELASLYQRCAFTVFPSVEEGFGLPILESLWYGKPSICANFGSMAEIAEGGGCLAVDVRDRQALYDALERLIEQTDLRRSLAEEAKARPIPSWRDYAASLRQEIDVLDQPRNRLGPIYFWVDSTRLFPRNSGIQRVTRQLAKALIAQGLRVVPVVWAKDDRGFQSASSEDLTHLEKWNGPASGEWSQWIDPNDAPSASWFVMPELPLHLSTEHQEDLLRFVSRFGIRSAAIFYDAIPWKLYEHFPNEMSLAHYNYMCLLSRFDLIFPISEFSRRDLLAFLSEALDKPQSLDRKILAAPLPGEFPDQARAESRRRAESRDTASILCISALEPRKNIQTLLAAFGEAQKRVHREIELTIVGRFIPGTSNGIRAAIEAAPGVRWFEDIDERQLEALCAAADFTVFPSTEEGFGLPIAQSLWNAKPCICANFGSMAELAEGGGCMTVDVRDAKQLADAIVRLTADRALQDKLAGEAASRPIKTWSDYGFEIAARMAQCLPEPRRRIPAIEKPEMERRVAAMRLAPRPTLSVCISTYNRAEWLATGLRNWSRLCPEPIPGVEMLVCDNASTDHTEKIVAPYRSRSDFSYRRNPVNVGMLGNLRETAHAAKGDYIWILGDDDLMMPGAIERILGAIANREHPALVYLNYAYSWAKSTEIVDFEAFFRDAPPIVPPEPDIAGPIREFSARNENFFTAIYALVFRRDHALNAYSQDTSGYSFSTMLNCVPTSNYVLNNMMEEEGVWIGDPQVVVNFNVSWNKYASLFVLERIPEVYEVAELMGASSVDRWRQNFLPSIIQYFELIYEPDQIVHSCFFDPARLVRRFKHLPAFRTACRDKLIPIYRTAQQSRHPAAQWPIEQVFAGVLSRAAEVTTRDRKVANA